MVPSIEYDNVLLLGIVFYMENIVYVEVTGLRGACTWKFEVLC